MIRLPWPPRALWVNSRVHFMARARAAGKARRDAWAIAREAGLIGFRNEPIPVSITFHPPNKIRRDMDGMHSAIKPMLDGVADAMGVDDSQFRPRLDIGDVVKGGAVVLAIIGAIKPEGEGNAS